MIMTKPILNAMTCDVEDYFQVSAFEPFVPRSDWDKWEPRVERNTHKVMDIFADGGIKATFFTLGWVAERFPGLVKRMVEDGHEVASHGYSHVRATTQTPDEFRADILKTKKILEDIAGTEVIGYRAASYSISKENLWALDILAETGHLYSSSIYPVKHDLYGIPDAPRFRYSPIEENAFTEIPVTTFDWLGKRWPAGGGGFFRFYPYAFSRFALRAINNKERQSGMFYFHPWEIDPHQPRPEQLSAKARFRHYLNLHKMESRLRRLMKDFDWGRMDQVFEIR
jgi:polysaccharide deacetylase family protein (PEP-CTERM system associated)